jgi:hypothetical protein
MSKWVTGMFASRTAADRAVDAILRAGYAKQDVSMMMTDEARRTHFGGSGTHSAVTNQNEKGHKAAEGAGVGGAVGGTVGAVAAAIAAIGTSLVVPGLGLVVAGPIAAALAGAGGGGAVGGLIGALAGAGIPEGHAKAYEAGLKRGHIVVGVQARTDENAKELEKWLEDAGAEKVKAA